MCGAIDPQRIMVHDFVPALGMLFSQEAFQDLDLKVDAVYGYASGVTDGPVGAEDQPLVAKGSPEKLQCRPIPPGIGDRLKSGQTCGHPGHGLAAQLVDVRDLDMQAG